ncbi:MAG: hypothetical protein EHM70_01455 [Chloroflexota bacterium]|nr:MAG: hypothetical protein EHM70_01455 [Chloroflexota bacterium]
MMKKLAVMLLFSILLVACARTTSTVETPATLVPTKPPENTPLPTGESGESQGGSTDAVIVYERTGGIAGRTVTWSIFADGQVLANDKEAEISADQVDKLIQEIDDLGFFEMPGSFLGLNNCNDCYTHVITVRKDGTTHTVTATDMTEGVPQELWEVVNKINTAVAGLE